jgi:hypothetical protein
MDPEKTLNRLLHRLKKAGITPAREEPSVPEAVSADLYELVTKKAANMRTRWNEPARPLQIISEIEEN